ncbi:carbohydrate ABC transporter permease [Nocardiopsis sp. RSe5-2]|uniref:Carbohydrate ABC transporter permease n=1 Tax=Nocardiopsis endophytica TaxID=3018445 RepID=A0ABT4UD42_9ACTN|nr:carbohydrate ABC transporter permease [Nocardiopsis endophytica]MDA2814876.1 carbohydrate ABC transporter permease [Nocardiopsis endophytica]
MSGAEAASGAGTVSQAGRRAGERGGAGRAPGGGRVGPAARFTVLVLLAVVFLLPLYVLVVTGFKPFAEAGAGRAWLPPQTWSLEGWSAAWDALGAGLWNSVKLVVPSAAAAALLGSLNGYVLSKWRFPGADTVFTLFLFGMFIPYQAVMIPLQQMLVGAGLMGGLFPLILAHTVYGIPICTLIFRNYYASLPQTLIEAARVDGAGLLRTYAHVVLPVSAPAFAVALIWQVTSAWNDFLFAVFLTGPGSWPVTVQLNNVAGSMVVPYNQQMAAAVLASLPTLVIYLVLGRYFMRGLMAGALKG